MFLFLGIILTFDQNTTCSNSQRFRSRCRRPTAAAGKLRAPPMSAFSINDMVLQEAAANGRLKVVAKRAG
ncbi:hypothetical protein J3E68DRAFT_404193 [Trichoderma sp. SZMC 28012]